MINNLKRLPSSKGKKHLQGKGLQDPMMESPKKIHYQNKMSHWDN